MFKKNYSLAKCFNLSLVMLLTLLHLSSTETLQRLSAMNILLPVCPHISCKPVFATVKAEGGCFEWSVENPHLVNIELIHTSSDQKGCVHKVIVSPKTNQVEGVAWLIATDTKYNEKFKCKIGFAEVDSIEISTRFDTNNVGELFELQVEARDAKKNLFSSLEGWNFNWMIENNSIVELKKSIDESKKLSPKRREVERQGFADIILLRGKSVGQIKVKCIILEKGIEKTSDLKQLYIVDPFFISPDLIYIMPRSSIELKIRYVSGMTIESQHLANYQWTIGDHTCGSISNEEEFKSNEKLCTTEIIVKDTRITDNNTAKAIVHVVYPDQIKIGYVHVLESNPKAKETSESLCNIYNYPYEKMSNNSEILLIEEHQYLVKYYSYYQSHLVHFSKESYKYDKTVYAREDELEYCLNDNMLLNYYLLRPKRPIFKRESIKAVLRLDNNPSLSEEKSLMIHSKVEIDKFDMEHFTLPYLGFITGPSSSNYEQELRLIVLGGSRKYKYATSKQDVIRVLNNVLYGHEIGESIIRVADEENEENYDEIKVRVSEIKDLSYLEQRQEVEVNSLFIVPILGLHDANNALKKDSIDYYIANSFTNCSKIISNPQIEHNHLIEHLPQKERESSGHSDLIIYKERNPSLFESIDRLYHLQSSSSSKTQAHKRYLEYTNYGLCDVTTFKGKAEGIGDISFIFLQHNPSSQSKEKSIKASTKTRINIYKEMSLKRPVHDQYTEDIIKKNGLLDPYIIRNISLVNNKKMFSFELENGLNQWVDIKHEVFLSDKAIMRLDNKKGEISCRAPYSINMEIKFKADASLILPRPASSRIALSVNCLAEPEKMSIFFLSTMKSGNIPAIYQMPQGIINYFVSHDSSEIARVYGFDRSGIMILNFAHFDGNIKSDQQPKIFEGISTEDYKKHSPKTMPIPQVSDEFFQSYLHFKTIGKTQVIYQANKNNKVTHTALIDVLALPLLEPNIGTIYVSDDNFFEITIKYGSGDYNITLNDNSLASFTSDLTNNKIVIKPKKPGELRITLTDLKMVGNPKAMATLYQADVKHIKLVGGGLIMVEKSLSIEVEVIDTFDKAFPIDQLKKIHLRLDDSFNLTNGLDIAYSDTHYQSIHSSFTVTGVKSGLYPITLTLSDIRSNTVTVEVFDKLEVFPPYLLLIPGSSYTLAITGGPQNLAKVFKRYSIADPNVASIAKDFPEVTAKHIGETLLKIELIYNYDYHKIYNDEVYDRHITNQTESLCVENVPVRVAFPSDIKIIGAAQRQVFTRSTIRLLTAFKLQNETFTYGIGKMKYKWEVQNKESAYIITFSKETYGERSCDGNQAQVAEDTCMLALEDKNHEDDSIGIFLQSKQEGVISISLNVNITYPDYYKKEQNVFYTAENVKIGDQVYVNINEFYGQDLMKSAMYMIPFDVDHELHTSKNTIQRYNIESTSSSDSIVDLSESGRVRTYNKTGRAYVKITGIEKDKNILPVVLPIFISEFYSLFVEKTNILMNLEIGQELQLAVILQHDSGKLFAEKFERLKLKVVQSHPVIAKAELVDHSSKLKLKALSQGQTHIILFHPNTRKIYDVFKITVSSTYHLGSLFTLNVGGTIQFMGHDRKKLDEITANSIWTSSDPSILTIDSKTGLATAKSEGVAVVQLKTAEEGIIKKMITVNVGKVQSIHIDKSKLPKYLTNKSQGSSDSIEYVLPVDFYTSINDSKLVFEDPLNVINQNIIFKCESNTSIAKVFERVANSKHECLIRMNQVIDQKTVPEQIEVKFLVFTLSKKELYSTTERFPFASSFSIKNNMKRLSFTSKGKPQKVFIDNMNDLEFNSQNEALVRIDNKDKSKGMIEVVVPEEVQGEFNDVRLTVKNTVTNQEEVLYVSYVGSAKQRTMFLGLIPMDTIVDTITLILLLVIIVILIIYLSSSKEQTRQVPGTSYSNQKYSAPKGSGLRGGPGDYRVY